MKYSEAGGTVDIRVIDEMRGDEERAVFNEVEHRLALQRTLGDGAIGPALARPAAPAARESR